MFVGMSVPQGKFARRNVDLPHPLLVIGAVIVLGGLFLYVLRSGHRVSTLEAILLVIFVLVFSRLSRWSARKRKEKRLRELEELRRKPVLGINE